MSQDDVNKLIDICHNSHDEHSLCLTLAHDLCSDFILIAWYITEKIWYIPIIYNKCGSDQIDTNQINDQHGWYINEKPRLDNIPIKHQTFKNLQICQFNNEIIIYNSVVDMSNIYKFVCESYIKSLAEQDMRRRDKFQQGLLLSNICHSIRTPLNGILHMTDMLMSVDQTLVEKGSNDCSNTKPSTDLNHIHQLNQDHLNYLNQSSILLANNIFDTIDIVQLNMDRLKINKNMFNIRELVNQVVAITTTLTKQSNVVFEYHVEPIVPEYAYSDSKRIKQILINLIENAFHNTISGEVTLYINATLIHLDQENYDGEGNQYNNDSNIGENNQYSLSFTVQDTGNSIDEKNKSYVFKPPEILCNIKQNNVKLRVCYLLANKLGGELQLSYSIPNKGNAFIFGLIICEEEPPIYDSVTLKTLRDKRVLLIDDGTDKINLCKLMDVYHMHYNTASSYEEILVLHVRKTYDLVICKIHLKTENGISICKQLRGLWANTIIVALTDDSTTLPKGIFHETMSLPVEECTFKNKLLSIFNTEYDSPHYNELCILIVEDDRINRIILEKLLRTKGYRKIDLAHNGDQAYKMIKLNPNYYDVLLIDIRMPGMSGFELAEKISALYSDNNSNNINSSNSNNSSNGNTEHPKIIGVTAQMIIDTDPKDHIKEFIYKPININELDEKIKSMVY
jgi:CheY-like chemotaxis protein